MKRFYFFSTKNCLFFGFQGIFKQIKSNSKIFSLGQNICRIFHFLAQFFFTTSETKLDYYQHRVHVRVALKVTERLKT